MRNYLRDLMNQTAPPPREPEGDLRSAQRQRARPTWEIREVGERGDQFEVWRGRRFLRDFTSEREALRFIDQAADPGDLVYRVAPDGYRSPLRGRRGWRGRR